MLPSLSFRNLWEHFSEIRFILNGCSGRTNQSCFILLAYPVCYIII